MAKYIILISNPFKNSNNVYINIKINRKQITEKLDNIEPVSITIPEHSLYLFNYIVDDVITICYNKPYIITPHGIIMNYYISNITHNKNSYISYLKYSIIMGDTESMWKLGEYYSDIRDYNNAKYYLLMAVKLNDSYAMMILANYYYIIEKNYDCMEKYSLMAAEYGNYDALITLGFRFKQLGLFDKMEKICLKSIEYNNLTALDILYEYYIDNDIYKAQYYKNIADEKGYKLFIDYDI